MSPFRPLPEGAICIQVHQNTFWLLPQKAIYWVEQQALLVADVHIGKALTFRRLGVPVPTGTTDGNLKKLSQLIEQLKAAKVYVLGDLLHAAAAQDSSVVQAMQRWREQHSNVLIVLIRGNHDEKAGEPASELNIDVVREPYLVQGFNLLHSLNDVTTTQTPHLNFSFSGHVHPVVVMSGKGKDRLRIPCFEVSKDHILLPAFGEFTGGFEVQRHNKNRLYAVTNNAVVAL
jgi:uncharacterized protein